MNPNPPARLALMHEELRFLAFLAGIGKADMNIGRQLAAVRLKDMPEHISRRAPSAEADERRAFDEVWAWLRHALRSTLNPSPMHKARRTRIMWATWLLLIDRVMQPPLILRVMRDTPKVRQWSRMGHGGAR